MRPKLSPTELNEAVKLAMKSVSTGYQAKQAFRNAMRKATQPGDNTVVDRVLGAALLAGEVSREREGEGGGERGRG